jgi:hypothetical protein
MRALVIFLFVLGAVAFMASCGSETTEVAWKNSTDSTGSVKNIVWALSTEWDETIPADATTASSAKEVTVTAGTVECLVDTAGDSTFGGIGQAKINGTFSAIELKEGESQVLTLQRN